MAIPPDWAEIRLGTPAVYRIVIQGDLDRSWSNQLDGLEIRTGPETQKPSFTILTGQLADQAALFGVLDQLYGLGFALLLVECVGAANS